ncbi:alkaline shock response membrane anchor protein AmaP [Streptomyces sp. NPDC049954]|uniref:alkaline shock response membrane anchor protein AmaP n=1 Tax=Streptomyces sp. NPDC049954 TaxID=3155779 RepID=UPI0034419097
MLRTVNRVLLALCGLVLIALGGPVLAIGLGVKPPSWWIHDGKHDVLLSRAERTKWRGEDWWWPVVIAALAVLLLLALWWLAAGLRRRRLAGLALDTGDGDGATLRGRALQDALAAGAERIDGVDRARVRLTGRRTSPRARLRLDLDPQANPVLVQHRTVTGALRTAQESAGLDSLPAEVRMFGAGHGADRVQ